MPYNQDGSFTPLIVFVNTQSMPMLSSGQTTSGPPALAEAMNAEFADIVTGLGQALNRLGFGGMLANLNMGGFQVNNVQPGVALTDAATVGQLPGSGAAPLFVTGTAPPTTSAAYIGQIFINTATQKIYQAVSAGNNASDWIGLN
jgi:hypothetical protein